MNASREKRVASKERERDVGKEGFCCCSVCTPLWGGVAREEHQRIQQKTATPRKEEHGN
jgi:hypothetical protein